jgi:hypothetical protein
VSGRTAARIAVVSGAAVAAALVVLVFRNAVALLLVLASLAVAAAAGWAALTRTGFVRVLAVLVAAAALIGGVRRGKPEGAPEG